MERPVRLLLVTLALALTTQVVAFNVDETRARYTVTAWTERDGMPSSYVRDIAQDRQGYLWLATYSGLVRFDGARFLAWQPRDGGPLPSEDLSVLLVARDGSLWVGGFGGVTRLVDGATDRKVSSAEGFFQGYVSALLEDRIGHIWVAGQSGVARFDGTRWQRLGRNEGLPERAGQRLHEDTNGDIWIGTSVGLYRRVPDETRFEPVPGVSFAIEDLAQDAAGNIVVPHPTKLFSVVSGSTPAPDDDDLKRSHGTRLLLDYQKQLWVGTRGQGLVRLRPGSNSRIFFDRLTTEHGLSANSILALFEDRERNVWIGTPFGLNRLSQNAVIPVPLGREMNGHVRALAEGDQSTWVATEESLLQFSGETQIDYGWKDTLPDYTLIALHYNPHDTTLWVSTNHGLVRLKGGVLQPFPTPGASVLNRIRSITTDEKGRLWLCDVDRGIYRSTDRSLTRFELVAGDKQASTLMAARDGRVWIGFIDGTVRSYRGEQSDSFSAAQGLPTTGTVTAIHEDRAGSIWVGTHRGLSRYRDGRFVTLTKAEGFPGPGPVAIADDSNGDLWLGVTGVGIVRLSPAEFDNIASDPTRQLTHSLFGPADGLRGTPVPGFGTRTAVRGTNGEMWFLTGNGVAVVDPARLTQRPASPIVIESLLAGENRYASGDETKLPPGASTLQFDYTVLSLAPLSQVDFRYKLEGFDSQWTDAGARRQAFFTNVPPGSYRFVVEAGYGTPRVSRAEWLFSIRPRFYQTSWFALAIALTSGIGLWGLWRLRLHQMQRRFTLVLDERARMGREIHDTLLQGLVGVAVQIKVIADQVSSSPAAARERLERVRKLVEEYIGETRQSIWDLRSPSLQGRDLAAVLRDAGEAVTADANVRFDLVVRGRPYACPPKVEEQLLRVGREALNNAVRHAHPSRVKVELIYERESVRLRVIDDGAGFNPDAPGLSTGAHWGLMSMRERAKQINAKLHLTSTPGRGTELELIVPAMATR
ncbi:MAG: hypothetical protein EHM55_08010 [Acidobacteria bacterium]|nr:MAG: hypothetical protein EHM55_08010 [Acidobacteriota bacterium]